MVVLLFQEKPFRTNLCFLKKCRMAKRWIYREFQKRTRTQIKILKTASFPNQNQNAFFQSNIYQLLRKRFGCVKVIKVFIKLSEKLVAKRQETFRDRYIPHIFHAPFLPPLCLFFEAALCLCKLSLSPYYFSHPLSDCRIRRSKNTWVVYFTVHIFFWNAGCI